MKELSIKEQYREIQKLKEPSILEQYQEIQVLKYINTLTNYKLKQAIVDILTNESERFGFLLKVFSSVFDIGYFLNFAQDSIYTYSSSHKKKIGLERTQRVKFQEIQILKDLEHKKRKDLKKLILKLSKSEEERIRYAKGICSNKKDIGGMLDISGRQIIRYFKLYNI